MNNFAGNALSKVWAAAAREYKATALTWAFLLGAVVFPAIIWAVVLVFTAFSVAIAGERAPLTGTVAVYDQTETGAAVEGVRRVFDPKAQAERRRAQLRAFLEENPQLVEMAGGQSQTMIDAAERAIESAPAPSVEVETVPPDADLDKIRTAVQRGDRLALLVIDERSLELSAERLTEEIEAEASDDADPTAAGESERDAGESDTEGPPADAEEPAGARSPGEYEIYHSIELDPEYLDQIKDAAHRAIQDERYRRLGIDADQVLLVAQNAPRARARLINERGDETESASNLQRFLPFIFLFLMYGAVLTGGNYLLMGTLEEKQSRVMEVLLSAVSPWQLLIGKMIGQALVGGTVFVIYGGVGLLAADRFGVISVLPDDPLTVIAILLYFVMAYLFLGAMMTAVGSAVTEFREAQALYPPITISLIVPFLLLIAIMENPSSLLARIFSFVPPTTPFVMVMRLSNPAYPVPIWEIIATLIVGFAGVVGMVALAARIFRVGVLSYGKPPSLLGLLKWAKHA